MLVIKQNNDLTIINPVRINDSELVKLDNLSAQINLMLEFMDVI